MTSCICLAILCSGVVPPETGALESYKNMSLHEASNTQLDHYLRLSDADIAPVGQKVAGFAMQFAGLNSGGAKANSCCLADGNETIVAMRAIAMANADCWTEYALNLTGLHFKDFSPQEKYRIRWYPVEFMESRVGSIYLQNLTEDLPDVAKVWYTFGSWKHWREALAAKDLIDPERIPNVDKRRRLVMARYTPTNLDQLRSGDIVFFMQKWSAGVFKDSWVGIAVQDPPDLKVLRRADTSRVLVVEGCPDPDTVDMMIVYRPVEVDREARKAILLRARKTIGPMPSAESMDERGCQSGYWFHLPMGVK